MSERRQVRHRAQDPSSPTPEPTSIEQPQGAEPYGEELAGPAHEAPVYEAPEVDEAPIEPQSSLPPVNVSDLMGDDDPASVQEPFDDPFTAEEIESPQQAPEAPSVNGGDFVVPALGSGAPSAPETHEQTSSLESVTPPLPSPTQPTQAATRTQALALGSYQPSWMDDFL